MSDNSLFSKIPERLRMLRLEDDISQEEMAKKLCISASMISNYETGRNIPPLQTIELIANEYGISVVWLLGLSDDKYCGVTSINKYSDILRIIFQLGEISKIGLEPAECENGEVCLSFNNCIILEMLKKWEGLRDAELSSEVYEIAKNNLVKKFDIRLYDEKTNQPTQDEQILMEEFHEPNRYRKLRVTKNNMRVK